MFYVHLVFLRAPVSPGPLESIQAPLLTHTVNLLLSTPCAIVVQCWRDPALQSRRYQTADKMLTKKTLESKRGDSWCNLSGAEQCSSGDVRQSF